MLESKGLLTLSKKDKIRRMKAIKAGHCACTGLNHPQRQSLKLITTNRQQNNHYFNAVPLATTLSLVSFYHPQRFFHLLTELQNPKFQSKMQFTTVFTVTFTIFGLLGQGIMAAPAPIAEAVAVAVPEAAPEAFPEAIAEAVADGDLVKRGFGCNGWPFEDDKKCHK